MAIDAYKEGLSKTTASDPVYLRLKQAKKDAEGRDNTRVDFISRLPMDIISYIAPRLILEDHPLEYDQFTKHHAPLKHGVSGLCKRVICITKAACMDGIQVHIS